MAYKAVIKRKESHDELTHWKYVKREKINGKWRYYYDTKSLKNDVRDTLGYDEKEAVEEASRTRLNALNKYDAYVDREGRVDRARKDALWEAYEKASKLNSEALDKFNKTPLGKVESTINKGKHALSSILYNVGDILVNASNKIDRR